MIQKNKKHTLTPFTRMIDYKVFSNLLLKVPTIIKLYLVDSILDINQYSFKDSILMNYKQYIPPNKA